MALYRYIEDEATYVHADDFFDHVALVAHNCYQVAKKDHENNIAFVGRLIQNGHLAMIEHFRFLFEVEKDAFENIRRFDDPYQDRFLDKGRFFISTSLRPLLEATGEKREAYFVLMSALDPSISALLPAFETKSGAKRIDPDKADLEEENRLLATYATYHIITDRGVTHELVRHRPCSFAQESTRYCNYGKDKFGNQLSFLRPQAYEANKEIYDAFFQQVSTTYFALLDNGCKPEQARSVLPNALRASIMVTCSLKEWLHIFSLRCSPFAHPDIRHVMEKVRQDLVSRGLLFKEEGNEQ